jgi:hypothetical protein
LLRAEIFFFVSNDYFASHFAAFWTLPPGTAETLSHSHVPASERDVVVFKHMQMRILQLGECHCPKGLHLTFSNVTNDKQYVLKEVTDAQCISTLRQPHHSRTFRTFSFTLLHVFD